MILDRQNCRCRSLIRRAFFELIVTAPVLRSVMPIFSRGRRIVGRRRRKSASAGCPVSGKAACRKWRSLCRYRRGLAGRQDVGYFSCRKQTPWPRSRVTSRRGEFFWWVMALPSRPETFPPSFRAMSRAFMATPVRPRFCAGGHGAAAPATVRRPVARVGVEGWLS